MRAAVQELPAAVGISLANWNWKVVHQFVLGRFGISLCRSSCLNYLHRLGFALKRPKKRLSRLMRLNGWPSWRRTPPCGTVRDALAARYSSLTRPTHFRADAELRGKWVPKGKPALVDSSSPRRGEKASYYSAVCLETGEVEWMELEGNSNGGTSAAFLNQLRGEHGWPLTVIWDNVPAHRGEAVREYLRTAGSGLRLVNLPGYNPDFNADEAIWNWVREEATGNLCLGTKALVREKVSDFLAGLACRKDEVKRRCRTVLQSRAEGFLRDSQPNPQCPTNVHLTLALV